MLRGSSGCAAPERPKPTSKRCAICASKRRSSVSTRMNCVSASPSRWRPRGRPSIWKTSPGCLSVGGSHGSSARPAERSAYSRLTSRAGLSSRSAMNLVCRRWSSGVHSTNSNCPTSTGFSQRQSAIFFAVEPCPQRPLFASGRFANGHVVDLERRELLEQLRAHRRREAVARARRVDQPIALVVPEDQRVERVRRRRCSRRSRTPGRD